jgi:hypothetical protein
MLTMKEAWERPVTKGIKEIKPFDKNIDIRVILLESRGVFPLKNTSTMTQFLVADSTASIFCNFYGEDYTHLQPGDILLISNAYASLYKDNLVLYCSKGGHAIKIGDFFMTYVDMPNMSLVEWEKNGEQYIIKPN